MKKTTLLGLLLTFAFASSVQAADIKVINQDAWFPEGPIWYHGKLFYVEYGRNTVMTWDGKKNEVFWKQDGCGPSAVLPTASGPSRLAASATDGSRSTISTFPPPFRNPSATA